MICSVVSKCLNACSLAALPFRDKTSFARGIQLLDDDEDDDEDAAADDVVTAN